MERDTPENRARRRGFCSFLTLTNAERLVFIDESFCKTGMRREYGRSLRGERVTGTRPFRSWKTISLIGAIRLGARPKLMTHRGAVNGRTFLRFVKTRLGPWLRPGDIVVMDNLNMHKMNAVRQAIVDVGATVIYLPTYSPELNPIEMLWADMKATSAASPSTSSPSSLLPSAASVVACPSRRSRGGFGTPTLRLNSTDHGFRHDSGPIRCSTALRAQAPHPCFA